MRIFFFGLSFCAYYSGNQTRSLFITLFLSVPFAEALFTAQSVRLELCFWLALIYISKRQTMFPSRISLVFYTGWLLF